MDTKKAFEEITNKLQSIEKELRKTQNEITGSREQFREMNSLLLKLGSIIQNLEGGCYNQKQNNQEEMKKSDEVFEEYCKDTHLRLQKVFEKYDRIKKIAKHNNISLTQIGRHSELSKIQSGPKTAGHSEKIHCELERKGNMFQTRPALVKLMECDYERIDNSIIKEVILEDLKDATCVKAYPEILKIVDKVLG